MALGDMEQHMRVSLLDPRWREQREAMLSKIRGSTRAGDDEITRNLVGLARTRPDIFGSARDEAARAVAAAVREKQITGAPPPHTAATRLLRRCWLLPRHCCGAAAAPAAAALLLRAH